MRINICHDQIHHRKQSARIHWYPNQQWAIFLRLTIVLLLEREPRTNKLLWSFGNEYMSVSLLDASRETRLRIHLNLSQRWAIFSRTTKCSFERKPTTGYLFEATVEFFSSECRMSREAISRIPLFNKLQLKLVSSVLLYDKGALGERGIYFVRNTIFKLIKPPAITSHPCKISPTFSSHGQRKFITLMRLRGNQRVFG